MSSITQTVLVCDRCGKRHIYTVDSKALEWGTIAGRDLCPECKKEYEKMFYDFISYYEKDVIQGGD